MIATFFSINFMSIMILLAILAMMYVNREVKIPATNLFVVCVIIMLVLTLVGTMDDVEASIKGLSAEEAARVVNLRIWMSWAGYVLRPCVILTELLIILQKSRYKILCIIPALINAVIYSTSLFGSGIAYSIDGYNRWHGGPLSITIYATLLLYVLILLYCSIQSFRVGEKRKSLILLVIFIQAILVSIHERTSGYEQGFTNEIMSLCILEYYIYLTNVYRQELNEKLDAYVDQIEKAGIRLQTLTTEVMEALASAIDAKDKYTHGHSSRVAEYSRKLAEMSGKTEEECDEIFYAALLHDVGKIGIPESIITKEGKLTKEEYEKIKEHPVLGEQILKRISEFPYLAVGAGSHHERYDGKGYPLGLKATDIPEIARIISVADAYDAMSSKRSYRDPIPQQIVREELVKGSGTQFDPDYARLMLHLIDVDTEYEMSEREEVVELAGRDELIIEGYRSNMSAGILITPVLTTLKMRINALDKTPDKTPVPSFILFDSLDGRVHSTEKEIKDLNYFEYGEVWLDGRTTTGGARKIQTNIIKTESPVIRKENEYRIEAVKIKDHELIKIIGKHQIVEVIVALPDSIRFSYIGLTGENCRISHVSIAKAEEESPQDFIPRIAEEITYIDGPVGDMPNVQIDGYRTDATEGVEVRDGLKISFHAKSLPTARLVWHCPFVDLFCSDDGKVNGLNYQDLAFVRFDGESWQCVEEYDIDLNVNKTDEFGGWEAWKKRNMEGIDAVVTFKVEGNNYTVITENGGLALKDTLITTGIEKPVYAAITGDQVAITNIRVG
ncbi:MAG: HD-GYP domain-containing protein [Lachnospiraceae bacterium]|nr:HD-GYP domain-containing protein [Lachnospiraceae bacterium]